MELLEVLFVLALAAALTALVQLYLPKSRIVMEHERALRFRNGRLLGEVGPGKYRLRPRTDELQTVDVRRRHLVVSGQEVLTSDRVPLKISLIAEYSVADVTKALSVVQAHTESLYALLQLALREQLATRDLDAALTDRGEIGTAVHAAVSEPAREFGIDLNAVHVRDFMMAGGLRNAYSDVIEARQQGLAALERARGEGAAVRSLANTAQVMEKHPGIMQLRLLQAVEQGSDNRIVVSMNPIDGSHPAVEAE